MKCADCKTPLKKGQVRRIPIGKNTKSVCHVCFKNYAQYKAKPAKTNEAKLDPPSKVNEAKPENNAISPAETATITTSSSEPDMKLNYQTKKETLIPEFTQMGGRLFINAEDVSRIRNAAVRRWPNSHLVVGIVDSSLPEREPESFRGKYEILIREVA